ncbi:hypothetical protein EV421DRAFT_226475 [Armillaria borealis]|uniref:Secreted protein n=1 Tax=Armillaria borealis TaxID=47425 RepID=A0AA39MTR3_9AGAR|nr:hypothetical protein EV421DRAFT_226475 [Armillaria borealis]
MCSSFFQALLLSQMLVRCLCRELRACRFDTCFSMYFWTGEPRQDQLYYRSRLQFVTATTNPTPTSILCNHFRRSTTSRGSSLNRTSTSTVELTYGMMCEDSPALFGTERAIRS